AVLVAGGLVQLRLGEPSGSGSVKREALDNRVCEVRAVERALLDRTVGQVGAGEVGVVERTEGEVLELGVGEVRPGQVGKAKMACPLNGSEVSVTERTLVQQHLIQICAGEVPTVHRGARPGGEREVAPK